MSMKTSVRRIGGLTSFFRCAYVALLLLATALRLPGADWDSGIAAHPDERFLADLAVQTSLWGDPNLVAPDFPYGHFPLYLLRALVLAAPDADPLYAGRLLSGLLGVVQVATAVAFGRRLAGKRGGVLAAGMLLCAPFPLQQARFYSVDVVGAVCVSVALLSVSRGRFGAGGALWGLAVACKVSLLWVGLPLFWAAFHEHLVPSRKNACYATVSLAHAFFRIVSLLLLSAALSFVFASPWALLRPLASWRGPWIQSLMATGTLDYPYTRQYLGTLPILYPLVQMGLWGLGPVVTLAGLAGLFGLALGWRKGAVGARYLWVATICGFAAMAGWYVKFPRYLLPVYPLWVAWAAWFLEQLRGGTHLGKAKPSIWRVAAVGVVAPTVLLGVAQLSIYDRPHPWLEASLWMAAEVPETGSIAVEHWDHPLPVPLAAGDTERWVRTTLPVMDEDTPEKMEHLQNAMRDSDVIAFSSARGYGALSRQPDRYAATIDWYRQVLSEREVLAFGRCPRLGPLALSDDPLADAGLPVSMTLAERCRTRLALRLPHLDESFRVYDAPTVILAVRRP